MKHHITSFVSNMISIQLPRSGMMRTERSDWPFACVVRSVEMPGLRCSWLTITRSAPWITNAPSSVITGISPRNTFSSRVSSLSFRRNVAYSGFEYVSPSRNACWYVNFGDWNSYSTKSST